MKIKTIQEFLHRGETVKVGTVFNAPAEIDFRAAYAWLMSGLAEEVKVVPKKKGPSKTRVVKPKENRKK